MENNVLQELWFNQDDYMLNDWKSKQDILIKYAQQYNQCDIDDLQDRLDRLEDDSCGLEDDLQEADEKIDKLTEAIKDAYDVLQDDISENINIDRAKDILSPYT